MKLRLFPKTADVRSVLVSRIEESQRIVGEAETKLARLTATGLVFSTGTGADQVLIEATKRNVEALNHQVQMLDSHGLPEVMMEIDL